MGYKMGSCFLSPSDLNMEGMKEILGIDQIIAKNLRRLRAMSGWTQVELAEKLNALGEDAKEVNAIHISKIENCEKGMGKKLMAKMCEAFGIEPYEFYLTDDSPLATGEEKEYLCMARQGKKLNVHDEMRRLMRYRLHEEMIKTSGAAQYKNVSGEILITDAAELEMLDIFREAEKLGVGAEILRYADLFVKSFNVGRGGPKGGGKGYGGATSKRGDSADKDDVSSE